ncbi:YMGG-like glycine zipper-containing protein [Pseudocnuella soli]|uniref:YMGG-like glycine zipper-containing protein n=1 Tax=Pseudocnuella soli TaxID=2502779 RepID=UPI00104F80E7|nr:YMGG-like glycine zipper-containing protein [Pseudocnuella soli]
MKKCLSILTLAFAMTIGSGIVNDADAQTRTKTKKGWSRKAKGAAIGGAAGAATGAVVSRNDSKGAVIGGVVGAGTGYIYGRKKDKKKGRQ